MAKRAVTGPIANTPYGTSRIRALDAEAVLSLGNFAWSFGQEEMWWGTGHFGALSQSDNASPFPALRVQNIHPIILPWVFRLPWSIPVPRLFRTTGRQSDLRPSVDRRPNLQL